MQYNLKTGNFCDFSKFRENILVPRSYFIPFSSLEELSKTDIRNERYSSSLVDCLSGEWDFNSSILFILKIVSEQTIILIQIKSSLIR